MPKEEQAHNRRLFFSSVCTQSRESSDIRRFRWRLSKASKKKSGGKKRKQILSYYKEFLSKTCLLSGLYSFSHIQRHLIKPSRGDWQSFVRLGRTDKAFLGRLLSSPRLCTREKPTVCLVRPTCQPHRIQIKMHLAPISSLSWRGWGWVLPSEWHVVAIAGTEEWMGGLGLKPAMNQRCRFET